MHIYNTGFFDVTLAATSHAKLNTNIRVIHWRCRRLALSLRRDTRTFIRTAFSYLQIRISTRKFLTGCTFTVEHRYPSIVSYAGSFSGCLSSTVSMQCSRDSTSKSSKKLLCVTRSTGEMYTRSLSSL